MRGRQPPAAKQPPPALRHLRAFNMAALTPAAQSRPACCRASALFPGHTNIHRQRMPHSPFLTPLSLLAAVPLYRCLPVSSQSHRHHKGGMATVAPHCRCQPVPLFALQQELTQPPAPPYMAVRWTPAYQRFPQHPKPALMGAAVWLGAVPLVPCMPGCRRASISTLRLPRMAHVAL